MSNYLTRLVRRASGAEQKGYATPTVPAAETAADTRDPFEATAPIGQYPASSTPLVSHQTIPGLPARAPEPVWHGVPPPSAPSETRPSVEARPPDAASHPPEPPGFRSVAISPERVRPSADSRRETKEVTRFEERKIVEREIKHETSQSAPNVVVPGALPARAAEPPTPAVDRKVPELDQPAPALVPPSEASAPMARESNVVLEPVKPRHEAIPPPLAVAREELRLVIGRMQVEVVPLPPAVPAPRASVTPQRRSAFAETASPARLEFGLAQM